MLRHQLEIFILKCKMLTWNIYQLYPFLALSRYSEHPHLHPELCLQHRCLGGECPWLLHKPVPVPCAKQSPAAKQRAKQTAKLAQKWVSLSGGGGQHTADGHHHHQPPATWTPGMLSTALTDTLLSVFIETVDLSVRKRGKNKTI